MKSWRLCLAIGHISLITASNIAVLYPFNLFGFHSTWAAFCYPLLFVLTDLTTRLLGPTLARQVVLASMLPGLLNSYIIATLFAKGQYQGLASLLTLHSLAFRIAVGSFLAYVVGQMLDIMVFQRYRQKASWWIAPAISITIASIVDTFIFFSVAFYQCSDPFLSAHWVEIAWVDLIVKLLVNVVGVVPLYGLALRAANRTPKISPQMADIH